MPSPRAAVGIRPYDLPADLDALVRVFMDSVAHHAPLDLDPPRLPVTADQARQRFERRHAGPDRLDLCATVDGVPIALVEARLQHDDITGFTGVYVDELAVAETHRGRGVGTLLMDTTERWARDQGAQSIALDAMVANAGALRLYEEHLGYARVAVILRKNLQPTDGPGTASR